MQNLLVSGPFNDFQNNILHNFLLKEKKRLSKVPPENKSHIRNLLIFGIKEQQLRYQTEQDSAEILERWLSRQTSIDYWNILTQLLVGVYQIHKQGFVGRSIEYDQIRVIDNNLIYKTFGYADSLNKAPENIFFKFSTYETDIWLIGAILWKIISKKSIYEEQQINDKINEIKLTFNFQINEQKIDQELYLLLQKMLEIYQNKRISFIQIFQHPRLQLNSQEEREIMCNFYNDMKLKDLLNIKKNSFLRDYLLYIKQEKESKSPRVFFFYLEDSPILKFFYQSYIEIQLLNLAYHLLFYFPNQNPNVLKELNGLIIQKMILISKQLKQSIIQSQLPNQFKGQEELFLNDHNYSKLKDQIIFQQNELIVINERFSQNFELHKMEEIDQKFNSYPTDGSFSLMSSLLVNILKNSRVNQKSNIYIKSVTLEQMFEYEVQDRVK